MAKLCVFILSLVLSQLSMLAAAQDYPKADIFGGYSYANIDTNDLTSRQSANGWELAASVNVNRWFAFEGDVSGYYKNYGIVVPGLGTFQANVSEYSYGAGPRINFRPLFLHALIGGDHLTGSSSGTSLSQDSLAGAFGGGVQYPISSGFSFRSSVDYVFTRHNIFGGPSFTQNNIRVGVGLVYSFGGKRPSNRQPQSDGQTSSISVPILAIRVVNRENVGAEIVAVTPGGTGGLVGLRVGDVVNQVDGKQIRSATELAAELSSKPSGTKVQLGYLARGMWQTTAAITLGQ